MTLKHVLKHFSKTEVQEDERFSLAPMREREELLSEHSELSNSGEGYISCAEHTVTVFSPFTSHFSQLCLPSPDATRHPLPREGNKVSCAEHTEKNLFSYLHIHLFTFKKCAFTLAEVLITLAIIGVVAAMTMPTLMQKYRYHVLENQFKKQYSILQQALLNMQREEGQIITKNNYPPHTFAPKFFKQMQIILNCGSSGCEQMDLDAANGEYANLTSKIYKTFNKSRFAGSGFFDDGQAMVSDGAFIMINHSQAGPTITITIDTNGYHKGPNIWGYDLFTFEILNDSGKLVPSGTEGTYFEASVDTRCSKSSSDKFNGITCSYHALSDSNYWKNLP